MTEKELSVLQAFMEATRPSEDIRPELDLGFSYEKQCIEMVEIRPDWKDKTIIRHYPFARIRYVDTQKVWRLYCQRGSGKWQIYSPQPESQDLETLLLAIKKDEYNCFKG